MDRFRWCFIGAGTLAKQVAAVLNRSGRHEIVSVYTRRMEAAQQFCAKFGGTAYATAEEAVRDARVDGVYIVTPHNSHYRYAKIALEAGKSVLCEKAFTLCAERAEELIALAKQKHLYLAEAMWTWFGEPANQAKKWLDSGVIGSVQTAHFTYHMKSIHYAPRVSDPKLGGGALLDVGVYPIAYLYRLFGYPQQIQCVGKLENGIDLGEELEFTFSSGVKATASVSIVDFKGFEKMSIQGSRGQIGARLYHFSDKIWLKPKAGKRQSFKGKTGYVLEFDIAASEIREGLTQSRMYPLQATADVMRIMDECRAQMGLTYDCEEH